MSSAHLGARATPTKAAARSPAGTVPNIHLGGGGLMASRKLAEIAKTIRSKNAGVDKITFDVIFPDRTSYAQVRESGVLSREFVCRIFGIAAAQISDYVEFDPALAIKFTIYRRTPSGSAGDADIFAASNMVRYSISRSREVETPRARAQHA
jgi:hypothetical protein